MPAKLHSTFYLVLLVEYFAIQPWLRYRESKLLLSKDVDAENGGRKWSNGIRNSIRQFKLHANNYNWSGFSLKQHFVEISEFNISKGQAEIFLIVNVRYLLDKHRWVGAYRIVIDRIGDINQLETISIRKNPFENQEIQFPKSRLVIGFLALSIFVFKSLPSLPQQSSTVNSVIHSTPVSLLWNQSNTISLSSSLNGTVGRNEIDIYAFKTDVGGKVTIEIVPIDSFECYLSIYNQNNSLIRRIYIGRIAGKIEIAPELSANYLIIIQPYRDAIGGSYIINVNSAP